MSEAFSQWVKQRRKALDLTQEALANRIGCSTVTIKKIEMGHRRPSQQIAELLAHHLEVPLEEQAAFVEFARTGVQTAVLSKRVVRHRPPSNLPISPNLLIGREDDIAAGLRLLLRETTRLLTVLGPPGIGKTRLSMAIADKALPEYPDGVFFVPLAPISDYTLVLPTVASVLGLQEIGPQTPLQRLIAYLHDKKALLVLDNFEQILAASPQIAELLAGCPWVKVLATSRAPLRVRHERQFPLSPLGVPDLSHLPDKEGMSRYAAVTLFMERAQAVNPDFTLTEDNAPAIAAICTRLDGLPLAIELISARIKLLPAAALLERLHGRLMLQSDGLRDLEPHHRTLNAAIEWSYNLLTDDEQRLFRRLAVFSGGCTFEALTAVCSADISIDLYEGMESLLNKSLIQSDEIMEDEPRFIMLQTIREYALQKLVESSEEEKVRQAHAVCFAHLVEQAERELISPNQPHWQRWLKAEHNNIRSALHYCHDNLLDSELELRLMGSIAFFWWQQSYFTEAQYFFGKALTRISPQIKAEFRANVFHEAARLYSTTGDFHHSVQCHREALKLHYELDDAPRIADSLTKLALSLLSTGETIESRKIVEQGMTIARERDLKYALSFVVSDYGLYMMRLGNLEQAEPYLREALNLGRKAGNRYMTMLMFNQLAYLCYLRGDNAEAATCAKQSLLLAKELSNPLKIADSFFCLALIDHTTKHNENGIHYAEQGYEYSRIAGDDRAIMNTLYMLCEIALKTGNYQQARSLYREVLCVYSFIQDPSAPVRQTVIHILQCICIIEVMEAHYERALRLWGALESPGKAVELSFIQDSKDMYNSPLSSLHSLLDDPLFAAARDEGRAMTLEQIVAYALSG